MLTQDYYQYKFPCGCKQEFVEVALIYINELELNLPGNVEEAETLLRATSKCNIILLFFIVNFVQLLYEILLCVQVPVQKQ